MWAVSSWCRWGLSDDLEARLYKCLANRRWAREVAARGFEAADHAMDALTDEEWLEAMKAHPRIGGRPGGEAAPPRARRRLEGSGRGDDRRGRARALAVRRGPGSLRVPPRVRHEALLRALRPRRLLPRRDRRLHVRGRPPPRPPAAQPIRIHHVQRHLSKIVLGDNQYAKSETHVVRVTRQGARHEIKDLNVSVALAGDFADTHLTGDNSKVLPTDTQKNTVFAFAHDGVGELADFAPRLARHFVSEFAPVYRARVHVEEFGWQRIHDHAFVRAGTEKRLAMVTCSDDGTWVVAGVSDLVVLKSTGSEFHGSIKDRYTTQPDTPT